MESRWAQRQHGHRTYIIAEASSNHAQSYDLAAALVRAAARSGADAIKFQTYSPEELAAEDVPILTGYDTRHDTWLRGLFPHDESVTLRQLLGPGGLPYDWHKPLQDIAVDMGIDFISTPFSVNAAHFLVSVIRVPLLKIASGDFTFLPLLDYAAGTELPLLLSTGATTALEVYDTVQRLWPLYASGRLVLLHCRAMYPCSAVNTDLAVLSTWRVAYPSMTLGWSDHTTDDTVVPAVAVALGARVIEKHLRLGGPGTPTADTNHSLNEAQFHTMVRAIRTAELALGEPLKTVHPQEKHERLWSRRSEKDWLRPTEAARAGAWAEE